MHFATNLYMDNSKAKASFRNSKKWKNFREELYRESPRDYITHKKLRKGYNVHHLDLNPEHYQDVEDHGKFINVNHNTHSWIHELYVYYHKDRAVLDRLKEVLDKMCDINCA